ncbi:MAG: helix-turn-helix transcriptional regulator [Lentisphaeria bacterium]|nr:helix-turn-helix transcriptional regulator [Lentisphaeria bacterium]
MLPEIQRVEFDIPFQTITRNTTEQLHRENLWARFLAQPLFDAKVISVGLARKVSYPAHPPTRAQDHCLVLVLQGELNVRLGKRRLIQKPGTLSFCPKGTLYSRGNRSAKSWWIYFTLLDHPVWDPLVQRGPYMRPYESTVHMLLLVSRIMEARQKQTVVSQLGALENSHALGQLIHRELRSAAVKKPSRRSLAIQKLAVEIHNVPQAKWSVSVMAKKTGLPPRTLNRLFKNELGMGPMDLVIKNRLDKASSLLLSTDYTIETIAGELGYKSAYSFSNLFHRHVGMRPGQFRKKCLTEAQDTPL